MTEVMPVSDTQALFDAQWNAANVTKPQLLIVNDTSQELLVEFRNRGDLVTFRADYPSLEETPIGNHKYGTRVYNVLAEVFTQSNRQRLYDLMGEIRRICHAQRHLMTNFQRILFVSFNEQTDEQENIWSCQIRLKLENVAILLDT